MGCRGPVVAHAYAEGGRGGGGELVGRLEELTPASCEGAWYLVTCSINATDVENLPPQNGQGCRFAASTEDDTEVFEARERCDGVSLEVLDTELDDRVDAVLLLRLDRPEYPPVLTERTEPSRSWERFCSILNRLFSSLKPRIISSLDDE